MNQDDGVIPPATTAALFDMVIGIEQAAAAFYVEMAAAFRHRPQISAFWHYLYSEELDHEAILRGIRDQLPPSVLVQAPDPELAKRVAEARRWLGGMGAESVNTLDDAYELAHDMEFSEVNVIFKVLALTVVPVDIHARFVVDHIERHQNRLLEFGREHGGKAWRQRVKVRRTGNP